jgi:hypothetical protein
MGKTHPVTALIATTACALLAFGTAQANDSTIPCNLPPDAGASVAVHPGTQVSKTQNHQSKTCVFSINGATATSPPAQQVLDALNFFRDPSPRFVTEKEVIPGAIAALMAAPSPVKEIPKDLIDVLAKATDRLQQCLAEFFSNKLPNMALEGGIVCRGVEPYTNPDTKAELLRKAGLAVGVPTLEIALTWQGQQFSSVVYLPITMKGLPPLR